MIDLSKHQLELTYPCSWIYKVVLLETTDTKKVAKEILGDREHTVKESNKSKKGKFKSYNLELMVHNDDDRKSNIRASWST